MTGSPCASRPPRGGLARSLLVAALLACHGPAAAAVVAEGTFSVTAPEPATVRFEVVLTPTGARIVADPGETLVFSYGRRSVLVIDPVESTYFPLPLELLNPLLETVTGYKPDGLGAAASGKTRTILGLRCQEVVVTGSTPPLSARAWRVEDPSWSSEYLLLETALGLPWTRAEGPAVLRGLPLQGQVEVRGRRPYRATWKITGLRRVPDAEEGYAVPRGFRMDLERLLSLQGGR